MRPLDKKLKIYVRQSFNFDRTRNLCNNDLNQ